MSTVEFQLEYDGPALRDGTMDVNELASSLLAVGDLIQEANRQVNEGRAEVSVRVKADFKRGSFDVALLIDQSLLEHAKNLIVPGGMIVGGATLLNLLFGEEVKKKGAIGITTGVLGVWKKLKGEKPKQTLTDTEKGITIFVTGDGNKVHVDASSANLYARENIRSSISGMIRPLTKPGIRSLEIREGKKAINTVNSEDIPTLLNQSLATSSTSDANVLRNTREALLQGVCAVL